MKKFILCALAAIALVFSAASCNSCSKDDVKFGVEYFANITGDADGNVNVTFTQGTLALNGTAGIDFVVSNMDTTAVNEELPYLDDLINSNDVKTREAAELMVTEMNKFNATSAEGTYDITLDARVRETLTGIEARVHRRFTNRETTEGDVPNSEQTNL